MRVQQILSAKGDHVTKVMSDESIRTTLLRLKTHNIGALVVSDDGETVVGIISERDLVRAMCEHDTSVPDMVVADLMTRAVQTCGADDDIEDVMDTMTSGRFRHMPVVEDGRLVGIVSIGDLVKNRLRELETEASALREYVTDYR